MRKGYVFSAAAVSAAMILTMAGAAFADDGAKDVKEYTNDGIVLSVPAEFDDLLLIDVPEDGDTLFTVRDKASVEAAEANDREDMGLGFLFSIGTTDEETLHEMLCEDMSGTQALAEDEDGTVYLYLHPTDVRVEFAKDADDAEKDADMERYSMLCEWAAGQMKEDFISRNTGLTELFYGNTSLDITLARIAWQDFRDYTISTLEQGPMEPQDVDPAPFLKQLEGMKLTYSDEEFPDGEYAVLTVDNTRYDFSFAQGQENFIREVITFDDGDTIETVYTAEFPDGSVKASAVMEDWYHALCEAGGR